MSDELKRLWGQNVKRFRLARKLSQAQLAAALDIRPSSVCRWEQGKAIPRDEHKLKIAEVLDFDVQAIFPLVRRSA